MVKLFGLYTKLKHLFLVSVALGVLFFLQSCPGTKERLLYDGLLPMYMGAVDFSHSQPRSLVAGLKEVDRDAGRVVYRPDVSSANSYVFRHGDRVLTTPAVMAAFLPDSTSRILTLGYDAGSQTYNVKVWEVKTLPSSTYQLFPDQPVFHFTIGKIDHGPLEGLHNNLTDRYSRNLAISPDGQKMMLGGCRLGASGCVEGEAKVWSLVTGQLLGKVTSGKDIYYTSFTPDGMKIVATYKDVSADGSSFEAAGVWSAVDYKPIKQLAGMYYVSSLAVSKDSQQLLVLGADKEKGKADLWNLNKDTTEPSKRIQFGAPFLVGAFNKDATGFYAYNATISNEPQITYTERDLVSFSLFVLDPLSQQPVQGAPFDSWVLIYMFNSWNFSFNSNESRYLAVDSVQNLTEVAVYGLSDYTYQPNYHKARGSLKLFFSWNPYELRDKIP